MRKFIALLICTTLLFLLAYPDSIAIANSLQSNRTDIILASGTLPVRNLTLNVDLYQQDSLSGSYRNFQIQYEVSNSNSNDWIALYEGSLPIKVGDQYNQFNQGHKSHKNWTWIKDGSQVYRTGVRYLYPKRYWIVYYRYSSFSLLSGNLYIVDQIREVTPTALPSINAVYLSNKGKIESKWSSSQFADQDWVGLYKNDPGYLGTYDKGYLDWQWVTKVSSSMQYEFNEYYKVKDGNYWIGYFSYNYEQGRYELREKQELPTPTVDRDIHFETLQFNDPNLELLKDYLQSFVQNDDFLNLCENLPNISRFIAEQMMPEGSRGRTTAALGIMRNDHQIVILAAMAGPSGRIYNPSVTRLQTLFTYLRNRYYPTLSDITVLPIRYPEFPNIGRINDAEQDIVMGMGALRSLDKSLQHYAVTATRPTCPNCLALLEANGFVVNPQRGVALIMLIVMEIRQLAADRFPPYPNRNNW